MQEGTSTFELPDTACGSGQSDGRTRKINGPITHLKSFIFGRLSRSLGTIKAGNISITNCDAGRHYAYETLVI